MGGDISCTFDPDNAATMIAVMVVGMGADNKGFVGNSSGRTRQGIFPNVSSEFE